MTRQDYQDLEDRLKKLSSLLSKPDMLNEGEQPKLESEVAEVCTQRLGEFWS